MALHHTCVCSGNPERGRFVCPWTGDCRCARRKTAVTTDAASIETYLGSCVDLNLATLDGPLHVSMRPGSKELPLLLAAYNPLDTSSRSVFCLVTHNGPLGTSNPHTTGCPARYMWQDATSVKDFIQKLPDEVHCLFLSYSGNLLQIYLMPVLSPKRAAFASCCCMTSATMSNQAV